MYLVSRRPQGLRTVAGVQADEGCSERATEAEAGLVAGCEDALLAEETETRPSSPRERRDEAGLASIHASSYARALVRSPPPAA